MTRKQGASCKPNLASVITSNVNKLNTPPKRQRLPDRFKKVRPDQMLSAKTDAF